MIELRYKNYIGSAEIDVEDNCLHGKLLHIRDLVTYEANSPEELKAEFESAVEDYLADCKALQKEPDTPFKGVFNVRVKPSLHRELAQFARSKGKSLNEYVSYVLTRHKDCDYTLESTATIARGYFLALRGSAKVRKSAHLTSMHANEGIWQTKVKEDVQRGSSAAIYQVFSTNEALQ